MCCFRICTNVHCPYAGMSIFENYTFVISDIFLFSSQQHYPALIREFIKDDHYRSVSTTSCSVQIFTVPTLVG